MAWDEGAVDYISRRFFDEDATDAQIASELSVQIGKPISKQVVIGIRHRRWPDRIGERNKRRSDALARRDSKIRKAISGGATIEEVTASFGIGDSTIYVAAPVHIYRRVNLSRMRNPMDIGGELDLSLEGEKTEAGFRFEEIESGQCRFPIGRDPDNGAYRFCGHSIERGSYCAEHAKIAVIEEPPFRDYFDWLVESSGIAPNAGVPRSELRSIIRQYAGEPRGVLE